MSSRYQLRFFDVIMIVISLVIGMGIFRAPATVALRAGSEFLFYVAWLVGGGLAVCGALVFADIGRRLPVTGAYFRIFAKAYHPSVAFAVNVVILVSNAASAAGVAIIGAEYLVHLLPSLAPTTMAAAMIAVLFVLNLAGLRASSLAQNVMMAIKLLMLAAIVAAMWVVPSAGAHQSVLVDSITRNPWEAFGMALLAVSFTYGGYQSTINFGGEVANGVRHLPVAIVVGVLAITAVYMLVNVAYVHVLGFETLAQSSSIAALVVNRAYGAAGSHALSAVLVVSVLGYVNISMMANPRVITAMSQDGVLPPALAVGDASGGLRQWSLIMFTALSIAAVFVGETFEIILNYTMFVDAIGLGLGAATVFWLAGGRPKIGVVVAAGIFIASCFYTATNIFLFDRQAAVVGICLVFAIWLVGVLLRRLSRRYA